MAQNNKGEIDTKHFLMAIIAIVAIVAISFIAVLMTNGNSGQAIQPIIIATDSGYSGSATYALSTDGLKAPTTDVTTISTKIIPDEDTYEKVATACDSSGDFECCMENCITSHSGGWCGARCGGGFTAYEYLDMNCDFIDCDSLGCSWQC